VETPRYWRREKTKEQIEIGEMKKEGNSNSNNIEEAARNEMMQNLFGEQSEDEEEESEDEPEIDSEHARIAIQSDYPSVLFIFSQFLNFF
jgi:hypothetical protein